MVGERLGEGENNKTVELIVNSAMIITNNIPRLNACCMYSECLPPLPPPQHVHNQREDERLEN
jgi:hypothetical protein